MSDNIQVVMVSRKTDSKEGPKSEIEAQLQDIKVTNFLIN